MEKPWKMPEKGKVRGNSADTDGQIVRLQRSDDRPIEPSGSVVPSQVSFVFKEKAND